MAERPRELDQRFQMGVNLDPGAAEFGRRRRILCVSRKSAEEKFG